MQNDEDDEKIDLSVIIEDKGYPIGMVIRNLEHLKRVLQFQTQEKGKFLSGQLVITKDKRGTWNDNT